MPWAWPVEVNNLEAQAFCRWKSARLNKEVRLLSHEEQFHLRDMASKTPGQLTANNNINSYGSPTPVDMHSGYIPGSSDEKYEKIYDVHGNVWRHSNSVLTVLDGFRTFPVYDDFTLPTIDGHHNHILGGSWTSLGNCANPNARY